MSISLVEVLTKMSFEMQNQRLRLFARVGIEAKLKIIQSQKTLFHKLKSLHNDTDNAVLTLSSLVLAVETEIGKIDDVNINAMKLRSKNVKQKVKRQKLLVYWAIVRTLKLEQNLSFREIAKYLSKYHKLKVAHSTIFELWNELEV